MIETIVTTQKAELDISVEVPENYIGKLLHVVIYTEDEKNPVTIVPKKKPSDYFGTMSIEEGEKMQEYVAKNRNEWERNF